MCPLPPEEPADCSVNSHVQHVNYEVLSLTVYLVYVLYMSWVNVFCSFIACSLAEELDAQRNPLDIIDNNRMA